MTQRLRFTNPWQAPSCSTYAFEPTAVAADEAGTPFITNQLRVSTTGEASLRDVEKVAQDLSARVVGVNEYLGDYQLLLSTPAANPQELRTIAKTAEQHDAIAEADGNWLMEGFLASPSKTSSSRASLKNTDVWGPMALGAPAIWDYIDAHGPLTKVQVGVVDEFHKGRWHSTLGAQPQSFLPPGTSSNSYGSTHGLHIAGIISATPDEETGMRGIAPNSELVIASPRILTGECTQQEDPSVEACSGPVNDHFTLANALTFATQRVGSHGSTRVLNLSIGAKLVPGGKDKNADPIAFGEYLASRLNALLDPSNVPPHAAAPDFLIVKAAGNESCSQRIKDEDVCNPQSPVGHASTQWELRGAAEKYPEVAARLITVGNLAQPQHKLPGNGFVVSANSNSGVDLAAPGANILSTVDIEQADDIEASGGKQTPNSYGLQSGTSQAAPHIAGLAATLFGANPKLTAKHVKRIIVSSSEDIPSAQWDGRNSKKTNARIANGTAAFQAALTSRGLSQDQIDRDLINASLGISYVRAEKPRDARYIPPRLLGTWCTVNEPSADTCFDFTEFMRSEGNKLIEFSSVGLEEHQSWWASPTAASARESTSVALGLCETSASAHATPRCTDDSKRVRLIYYPPGAVSDPQSTDAGHDVSYPRLIEGYKDGDGSLVTEGEPYRLTLGATGDFARLPFEFAEIPVCQDLSGKEAVLKWINEVPPSLLGNSDGVGGWAVGDVYDAFNDYETYDPCAAISWVKLFTAGGSGSSNWHIMLFHHGKYFGTATENGVAYSATVTRLSDGGIQIKYPFPKAGESDAAGTGSAVSTFTWKTEDRAIVREGDLPPFYKGEDGGARHIITR